MSDDLVRRARDCANGVGRFKTDRGDFGLLDDLADRIEALTAERDALRDALKWYESQRLDAIVRAKAVHASEDADVLVLCRRHGYGAVIDSACRQWATIPEGASGAFFVGGSIGDTTAHTALSRKATP